MARMIFFILCIFFGQYSAAQGPNGLVTQTFYVAGNCGLCEKAITEAAASRGVKHAIWDERTNLLTLKYDRRKITSAEILRKVAYAGYDNDLYLAPDEAYRKLQGCCRYERKFIKGQDAAPQKQEHVHPAPVQEKQADAHALPVGGEPVQQPGVKASGLSAVYDQYFVLKDALVKDNKTSASAAAGELLKALSEVNMSDLGQHGHEALMKNLPRLKSESSAIAGTTDLEKQRTHFGRLSDHLYRVMKTIPPGYQVYLDHCPMFNDGKGANWISRDKAISNPYYGAKMPTCGKVAETLR